MTSIQFAIDAGWKILQWKNKDGWYFVIGEHPDYVKVDNIGLDYDVTYQQTLLDIQRLMKGGK